MLKTLTKQSKQSYQLFKYVINEATNFIDVRKYSRINDELLKCQNIHQIFNLFVNLHKLICFQNQANQNQDRIVETTNKHKTNMTKSKISISTSSSNTNEQSEQLSLKKQIQTQQIKIEQLQTKIQQLKTQTFRTQKMMMTNKKLYCSIYQKNMEEAVEIILQKQDQIQQLKENQTLLLDKIKQRDQLLQSTLKLLQNNKRNEYQK